MQKILVVEDEYFALKSIVKILLESNLDVLEVGEATNGHEAVTYLRDNPDVDLVISDIRMDGMDGLALAEYINSECEDTHVILVTAHENFEYARLAIKFCVSDYLIKPIFKENLLASVDRVIKKITEVIEKGEEQQRDLRQRVYQQYVTLKTLASNKELLSQVASNYWKNQEQAFRILVLQTEERDEIDNIETLIKGRVPNVEFDYWFNRIHNEYIFIVFSQELGSGKLDLSEDVKKVIHYLFTCKSVAVTVGSSRVYRGADNINEAYNEAVYAINQRLLSGWCNVYIYNDFSTKKVLLDNNWEYEIQRTINNGNLEEAKEVATKLIYDIVDADGTIENLYELILSMLKVLSDVLGRKSELPERSRSGSLRRTFSRRYDLYGFNRLSDLVSWIEETISYVCLNAEENIEKKGEVIEDIVNYVRINYYRNISLRDLAENKYFMNYSYLSRLFSQKLGISFSKFLIDFRLSKSKRLLDDPSLLITQVAFEVGYNDVSHYIHSFRKAYGVTPEEYRNGK